MIGATSRPALLQRAEACDERTINPVRDAPALAILTKQAVRICRRASAFTVIRKTTTEVTAAVAMLVALGA